MLSRFPFFGMFAALAALYIGERALTGAGHWVLLGAGGALLVATLVTAVLRMNGAAGDRRRAYALIALEYTLVLFGVLVYFAQSKDVALVPAGKVQELCRVAWPALVALGAFPAVAMELALFSTLKAPAVEVWRVLAGRRAARIVALGFVIFAAVNYTASAWNRKIDLSYFKTTKAGTATLALVESLTQPVEIFLFFPPGNEVLEQARAYTEALTRANPLVTTRVVDQALDIDLARDLKVRANGYLVVRTAARSEDLKLGTDLEDARSTLRDLDAEVQERLLKVVRPSRVAYFTTGHDERDWSPPTSDARLGLSDLKNLLEGLGFTVRRLGLTEGLGREVPSDATLVVVPGPLSPFSPAERAAVQNYLSRGGRLLGFADPERGAADPELYAPLGVQVGTAPLATDKYIVRVENRGESPYDMATTQASSHPAAKTLQQGAGRLYVVFLGGGAVHRIEPKVAGLEVTPIVRSMTGVWEDSTKNGAFDDKTEKRDSWPLMMAIEGKVAPASAPVNPAPDATKPDVTPTAMVAPPSDPHAGHDHGHGHAHELEPKGASAAPAAAAAVPGEVKARAVIVGDTDMAATGVLRNPGNAYTLADAVRWLAGDDATVGKIESEKDEPIVHRKDEDTIWFYGTSFLLPAFVLGLGLLMTRRRGAGAKA